MRHRLALAALWVAAALLCWSGCGAPGEPLPPLLNIPARTIDLAVRQQADELVLSWTLPAQTTEGIPLKDLERVVVRGMEVEEGAPEAAAFVAGARELDVMARPAEKHTLGERVELRLKLPSAAGRRVALALENHSRRGRTEGISNVVVIEIAAAAPAPSSLVAVAQAQAIRLDWPALGSASGYNVYRRVDPLLQFVLLGSAAAPPFEDADFRWSTRYVYRVRSFVTTSSGAAESADSPLAEVVPEDLFPPSVPSGLQAVAGESAVELSWLPSPELDAAGYHVYRSAASGPPVRLTAEPIAATAFTDQSVSRLQRYSYSVSAVDARGNQSAPSTPVPVSVP